MSAKNLKGSSPGFTLVEVLVALAMAFIVADLGYLLVRYAHRQVRIWQAQEQVTRAGHYLLERFAKDIRNAQGMLEGSSTQLMLLSETGARIIYLFEGGILTRDGSTLLTKDLRLTTFELAYLMDSPGACVALSGSQVLVKNNENWATNVSSELAGRVQAIRISWELQSATGEKMSGCTTIGLRNRSFGHEQ